MLYVIDQCCAGGDPAASAAVDAVTAAAVIAAAAAAVTGATTSGDAQPGAAAVASATTSSDAPAAIDGAISSVPVVSDIDKNGESTGEKCLLLHVIDQCCAGGDPAAAAASASSVTAAAVTATAAAAVTGGEEGGQAELDHKTFQNEIEAFVASGKKNKVRNSATRFQLLPNALDVAERLQDFMFQHVRRFNGGLFVKHDCDEEEDFALCAVFGTLTDRRPEGNSVFLGKDCFLIGEGHALTHPLFDGLLPTDMCDYNCYLRVEDACLVATEQLRMHTQLVLRPQNHTEKLEKTERTRRNNQKFYKLLTMRLDYCDAIEGYLVGIPTNGRDLQRRLPQMVQDVYVAATAHVTRASGDFSVENMEPKDKFVKKLHASFSNTPSNIESEHVNWVQIAAEFLLFCISFPAVYPTQWLQYHHHVYMRDTVVSFCDVPYPLNIMLFRSILFGMFTDEFWINKGGNRDFSLRNRDGQLFKAFTNRLCALNDAEMFHIGGCNDGSNRATRLAFQEHDDDAEFLLPMPIVDGEDVVKIRGLMPFEIDAFAKLDIENALKGKSKSLQVPVKLIDTFLNRARQMRDFWGRL